MQPDTPIELYPLCLQEIASLCGLHVMLTLVENYGGCVLYVPEVYTVEHPLNNLLGTPGAERLIRNYAGERLEIPRAQAARLYERNQQIRTARRRGDSLDKIALTFSLTARQTRDICHSEKK